MPHLQTENPPLAPHLPNGSSTGPWARCASYNRECVYFKDSECMNICSVVLCLGLSIGNKVFKIEAIVASYQWQIFYCDVVSTLKRNHT